MTMGTVAQDYKVLSAEQGFSEAQFNLGALYCLGEGVDQDDNRYMLNIATLNGP